uniref:TP53-binding protein 1 n=1 Tax=Leptobrachium leishanense TaxID=445787 RepID=A0A8C5Q2U4_9ANUR
MLVQLGKRMDSTGSQLDPDFSQQDTPCLIVEDSQPGSTGTEDDLERARFGLIAQHLPTLQTQAESPVLEYVPGCQSNRHAAGENVGDSSKENSLVEPIKGLHTPPGDGHFSQVIERISYPSKISSDLKCEETNQLKDAAECTTQSLQADDSQLAFGALELSQSQDLEGLATLNDNCKSLPTLIANTVPQTAECNKDSRPCPETSEKDKNEAHCQAETLTQKPEDLHVKETSLVDPCEVKMDIDVKPDTVGCSQEESSENEQIKQDAPSEEAKSSPEIEEQNMDTSDIASSQEDLFGQPNVSDSQQSPALDKIVSTPAATLHLLHLSGQTGLTTENVSGSSSDLVSPFPEAFQPTPIMIPSSPTEKPGEVSLGLPQASTPVCQTAPAFVPGSFVVPSQPQFSHDVFMPTPSLEDSKEAMDPPIIPKSVEILKAPELIPEVTELDLNSQTDTADECKLLLSTSEASELMEASDVHAKKLGDDSGGTQIGDLEQSLCPSSDGVEVVAPINLCLQEKKDLNCQTSLAQVRTESTISNEEISTDISATKGETEKEIKTDDCIDLTKDSGKQATLDASLNSDASLSILDQDVPEDGKLSLAVEKMSDSSSVEEVPETPCENDAEDSMQSDDERVVNEGGNLKLMLSETETQRFYTEEMESSQMEEEDAMEIEQCTTFKENESSARCEKSQPLTDLGPVSQKVGMHEESNIICEDQNMKDKNKTTSDLPLANTVSHVNVCHALPAESERNILESVHETGKETFLGSAMEEPTEKFNSDELKNDLKEKSECSAPVACDSVCNNPAFPLKPATDILGDAALRSVGKNDGNRIAKEVEGHAESVKAGKSLSPLSVLEKPQSCNACLDDIADLGVSPMENPQLAVSPEIKECTIKPVKENLISIHPVDEDMSVDQTENDGVKISLEVNLQPGGDLKKAVQENPKSSDVHEEPDFAVVERTVDLSVIVDSCQAKDTADSRQKRPPELPAEVLSAPEYKKMRENSTNEISEAMPKDNLKSELRVGDHQRHGEENLNPVPLERETSAARVDEVAKEVVDLSMDTSEEAAHGANTELQEKTAEQSARSLCESSNEMPFHFTLPKDGDLIQPMSSVTPPLIGQLKRGPRRHSTPIEVGGCPDSTLATSDVTAENTMATTNVTVESPLVTTDVSDESERTNSGPASNADGKLCLRTKLITPMNEESEGASQFNLEKPNVPEKTNGMAAVAGIVASAEESPSVFTRVCEVRREEETRGQNLPTTPVRGKFSNSEGKEPEALGDMYEQRLASQSAPGESVQESLSDQDVDPMETDESPEENHEKNVALNAADQETDMAWGLQKGSDSRQTNLKPDTRPAEKAEKSEAAQKHKHGDDTDSVHSQEAEEPVIECQEFDNEISPSRTVASSLTSGDLADISSFSSKTSSLQRTSSGASSGLSGAQSVSGSGAERTKASASHKGKAGQLEPKDFLIPSARGAGGKLSPRKVPSQPGSPHRPGGQTGVPVSEDDADASLGNRPGAKAPLTPRGRGRRGRPPSRGAGSRETPLHTHGNPEDLTTAAIPEDETYTRINVRHPDAADKSDSGVPITRRSDSPEIPYQAPSKSDSLDSSSGSSFVGLRVVAKWSSNGYFYSGKITQDVGGGKYKLLFDDGYECDVLGKDILLCDPIPLDTEVTALSEDEYFSAGVVKAHKRDSGELYYCIEKEGQRKWYKRTAVILSLEQGNRLREQFGLGPYEPLTPLTKASDISLDNLVEGKRKRRSNLSAASTPSASSTSSTSTPTRKASENPRSSLGPLSGKRKLISSDEEKSPAKRGRKSLIAKTGATKGEFMSPDESGDNAGDELAVEESHGPLPQSRTLFIGYAFLLTSATATDKLQNRLESQQFPSISSEEEDEYIEGTPYDRKYTEAQLRAGGGYILEEFNEAQCNAAYQCLLIADQHCRTRKYFLCLASGIPCVSHVWVQDSCHANELQNFQNYLLPAGYSLQEEKILEWHESRHPFKDMRFLVVSDQKENFLDMWAEIVMVAGATSAKQHNSTQSNNDVAMGNFDLVLSDRSCPETILKCAHALNLQIVSQEWIIQCLINGDKLGYHSHPKYKHDYAPS